jgi:hypothetical protein
MQDWNRVFGIGVGTDHIGTTREPIWIHEFCHISGKRLLQVGVLLILYSSIEGFAIPFLGSSRLGLSAHALSGLQGVFFLTQGLLWTRLRHGVAASRIAFWCSIYSVIAILAALTIAAVWSASKLSHWRANFPS